MAKKLGIVPGSTLFYDLEAFNTKKSRACTSSALWFVNSWTRQLHTQGYASGYYSSAASGIRMLDDARVRTTQQDPAARPAVDRRLGRQGQHQLVLHPQRRLAALRPGQAVPRRPQRAHGGVTINIDTNYLNLRRRSSPA